MEVAGGLNHDGEEVSPPTVEQEEDSSGPAIMTGESVDIDLEGGGDEEPQATSGGGTAEQAPVPDAPQTSGADAASPPQLFESFDDNSGGDTDLDIIVKDPKKHSDGTFSMSYVGYTVNTTTKRKVPQYFAAAELSVLRRYSDFIWVREQIIKEFPGHVIPPMPPKHGLSQVDKFDPLFLEVRRRGLERFIRRIAMHPVLSFSSSLRLFLESKAHEFATLKKERERSLMDAIGESALKLTTKMMVKIPLDSRFVATRAHVDGLEQAMRKLEAGTLESAEIGIRLCGANSEMSASLRKLAESETELAALLTSMQETFDQQPKEIKSFTQALGQHVLETARDYQLYCESIRDLLDRRDAVERDSHLLVQLLEEKRRERDQVTSDDQKMSVGAITGTKPEAVKEEKLNSIDAEIKDLQRSVNKCHDYCELTTSTVVADVQSWNIRKAEDTLKMFKGLADAKVAYLNSMLGKWDAVLAHQ
eukprot:gene23385-20623_t